MVVEEVVVVTDRRSDDCDVVALGWSPPAGIRSHPGPKRVSLVTGDRRHGL